MKILVTGGAGFIGSFLCEELLGRGHEIFVLDDLSTGSLANLEELDGKSGFHFIKGSVLRRSPLLDLVATCEIVVHLAAAVGVRLIVEKPLESLHTNIRGTELVLELANRFRKKVFVASTSEVYGRNPKAPLSEDDDRVYGSTTIARWSYAGSKALDEFFALAYAKTSGLPIIIGRFFNTVGPRQTGRYGMVIPRLVRQALAGKPLTVYGDGTQTRSFTFVGDVVHAVADLLFESRAAGQVFNIGGEQEISIGALAEKVKQLSGSSSPIAYVPYEQAYEEGFEDMQRRVPDLTKLKTLIGYRNTLSLDDILLRVIEHERSRPASTDW
jgi:UDP-glucose 4-epimerase